MNYQMVQVHNFQSLFHIYSNLKSLKNFKNMFHEFLQIYIHYPYLILQNLGQYILNLMQVIFNKYNLI